MFGTFAQEQPQTKIAYGLVHSIGSRHPIAIAFHEWGAMARDVVRARSWPERPRQLFGRPGLSPARRRFASRDDTGGILLLHRITTHDARGIGPCDEIVAIDGAACARLVHGRP